jgi:hypothetical protein
MSPTNGCKLFTELLVEAHIKAGRRGHMLGSDMVDDLKRAGYVGIERMDTKQPLAPWPRDERLKRIGAMVLMSCDSTFHAYAMVMFTRYVFFLRGPPPPHTHTHKPRKVV